VSDGYEVVELKPTWGGGSILSFGLLFSLLLALQSLSAMQGIQHWSRLIVFGVQGVALLGLVLGFCGWRRTPQSFLARAGLLLNLAVFLSCLGAVISSQFRF
jgi:hypothetical protein